jgi:hypothetical protein
MRPRQGQNLGMHLSHHLLDEMPVFFKCILIRRISHHHPSIGIKLTHDVMKSFSLHVAINMYYGRDTFLIPREVLSFLRV